MSKSRKLPCLKPQTEAMLAGRFSVGWSDNTPLSLIVAPEATAAQSERTNRRFMTLDGINPRLAELLWDIHKTRELVPTLADDSTREQARQFIAEDETKFTRLCALALQINDVAFFDQVAYATQAMRDHPAKGEFVFNAWRECGNENALLADICRAVNERIYMDNRTVQDILGKLGLPAKKANTDPKSRTRRS